MFLQSLEFLKKSCCNAFLKFVSYRKTNFIFLIYYFYHNVCLFSVKTVSAKATFPLLQKSSGESKLGTYKVLNKLKA